MTHHRTPVKKKYTKVAQKKREAQQHVLPRFASSTTPRNNTQWWENTQTISCVRQKTKQNRRKTKKNVLPFGQKPADVFATPFWVFVPVIHSVLKRAQWDALAANDESEAAIVACANVHPD